MLSDTVGERIATWRRRRKWNREKLAEMCARFGMPELTPSVITNIESGRRTGASRRRTVSVDELMVFAWALNVPPVLLIVPYPDQQEMELLPGERMPTFNAYHWIKGGPVGNPAFSRAEGFERAAAIDYGYMQATLPLRLLELHDQKVNFRMELNIALLSAWEDKPEDVNAGDTPPVSDPVKSSEVRRVTRLANWEYVLTRIREQDTSLLATRDRMRELDYPLPVLPDSLRYLADMTLKQYEQEKAAMPDVALDYAEAHANERPWDNE